MRSNSWLAAIRRASLARASASASLRRTRLAKPSTSTKATIRSSYWNDRSVLKRGLLSSVQAHLATLQLHLPQLLQADDVVARRVRARDLEDRHLVVGGVGPQADV